MTTDETIVVLDDETIDKIAAGEVIERPASVVKELLENAVDAGASAITIELRGSPGEFIRVSDDGCGMSRRDAKMAFLRHATSKVRASSDLDAILTMGFRGEALASIAAVAQVELVTRRAQDSVGTRIVYEGGTFTLEQDAPSPVGTAVTCRDLFFNTPARRKFQKRPSTELEHIYDVAGRQALAQPGTRLRLVHNGKEGILAQGQNDKRAAITELHGPGLAKVLLPVVAGSAGTQIHGFVSPPDVTRPTRSTQCIFVNSRPVAAPSLVRLIETTYGKRLPPGRYPAVFIWMSTDPRSIDVNVHPAKREIRFSGDHEVFRLLAQAVSSALRSAGASPDLGRKLGGGDRSAQGWLGGPTGPAVREREGREGPSFAGEGAAAYLEAPGDGRVPARPPGSHPEAAGIPRAQARQEQPIDWCPATQGTGSAQAVPSETERVRACGFTPLGTFLGTYILAQDGCDLVVIDQHAAHERVLYDSVLDGMSRGCAASQTLFPMTLELRAGAVARLSEYLGDLARMGFVLEEFGTTSLLLRAVPVALAGIRQGDLATAVLAALEAFSDEMPRGEPDPDDVLGRFAAGVACKAAVKGRTALEPVEVERLLSDLARTSDPYSCPHGRPTLLRISQAELERAFRRR